MPKWADFPGQKSAEEVDSGTRDLDRGLGQGPAVPAVVSRASAGSRNPLESPLQKPRISKILSK